MSGSLFPVTDEMKMIFDDHYNGTIESIQVILTSLREKGYNSQAQAVRLLMAKLKLSLVDADNIVMNADAWSAEKEETEKAREALSSGKSIEEALGPDITILSIEIGLLNQ
jgi:hypothetical protein